jgi:hypothetical protein
MKDVPAALLAALRRLPGTRATVFLVLEEDEYETKFGDGRFLYAKAAFLDESAAAAVKAPKGMLFHRRTVEIEREEARNQLVADLELGPNEHFTLEKVVQLLSAAR